MDFFSKVGSKITSAGQGMATQTKNLTEIAKLNMNISSNEKDIEEMYSIIGKVIYESDIENVDSAAYEYIQKINVLKQEIEEIKATIKRVKEVKAYEYCDSKSQGGQNDSNKRRCLNCGMGIEQGNKFCISCGTPVPEIEEVEQEVVQEQLVCSNCQTALPPGTKFCNICGTKVNS